MVEIRGGLEKVYNEEIQNVCLTLSREKAQHVARMRDKTNAYKRFGHKSCRRERPLEGNVPGIGYKYIYIYIYI